MGKGRIVGNGKTKEVFIDGRELSPRPSQKVFNHSPDGFNWGYEGSGPAQLALAILLDFTDPEFARKNYQDFKREFISQVQMDKDFEMDIEIVEDWISDRQSSSKFNLLMSSKIKDLAKKIALKQNIDLNYLQNNKDVIFVAQVKGPDGNQYYYTVDTERKPGYVVVNLYTIDGEFVWSHNEFNKLNKDRTKWEGYDFSNIKEDIVRLNNL